MVHDGGTGAPPVGRGDSGPNWVRVLGAIALVLSATVWLFGLVALGRVATSGEDQRVVVEAPTVPVAPAGLVPPEYHRAGEGVRSAAMLAAAAPMPDPVWIKATAASTGIPVRAMTAYGRATLALAIEQPACRLGWTTIASIGWIESGHGTHGGTSLGSDGRPLRPILGPALDGTTGFAAVPATPRTSALDGDPKWDHAMGPMQVIPSTWLRWASGGDSDDMADPQQIDDAAYVAGRYLCASGLSLATGAGWERAVLSYNHSQKYARDVLDQANRYARTSNGP